MVLFDYTVCMVQVIAGKREEMGHHSVGNINALSLAIGSACVRSWLGSWCGCCVALGSRLPWLNPLPLYFMPQRGQFPRQIK